MKNKKVILLGGLVVVLVIAGLVVFGNSSTSKGSMFSFKGKLPDINQKLSEVRKGKDIQWDIYKRLNTPRLSAAPGSPWGPATGGQNVILGRLLFTAPVQQNTPEEEYLSLSKLDITFDSEGTELDNLMLYPVAHDNDSTYGIRGQSLYSSNNNAVYRFDFLQNIYTQAAGTITEGETPPMFEEYTLRGDVLFTSIKGGTLNASIKNLNTGANQLGDGLKGASIEYSGKWHNGPQYSTPNQDSVQLNPSGPLTYAAGTTITCIRCNRN